MIETTSLPGRATWKGPCPTDGCVYEVVARRVPTGQRAGAAGAGDVIDLTVPLPSGRTIRKVAAYRDDQPPAYADPDPGQQPGPGGAADGDTPEVRPHPVPAEPGPGPVGDEPDGDVDDDTGGRRRRWWPRGGGVAGPGEPVDELIPGIYR